MNVIPTANKLPHDLKPCLPAESDCKLSVASSLGSSGFIKLSVASVPSAPPSVYPLRSPRLLAAALFAGFTSSISFATAARRGSLCWYFGSILNRMPHWLIALLTLTLVEFVCFGIWARQVGFYLDDWTMLANLEFGPKSFGLGVLHYIIADNRVAIRPVEALHLAGIHAIFGLHPIGYHLTNSLLEVVASMVLYLILNALGQRPVAALSSSILFQVYPSHDATHYWIVCGSMVMSLTAYLLSLWCSIKAALTNRNVYHALSACSFVISVFNYEAFLPLALINGACVFLVKQRSCKSAILSARYAFLATTPLVFVGLAYFAYTRIWLRSLHVISFHDISFSWHTFSHAIFEGLLVNSPGHLGPFLSDHVRQVIASGFGAGHVVLITVLSVSVLLALNNLLKINNPPMLSNWHMVLLGLIAIIVSYTLFGLNPEYVPKLDNLFNRLNLGASVGVAFVFAGMLGFFERSVITKKVCSSAALAKIMATLCLSVILFCVLADWGLSHPWVVSWKMQSHISNALKKSSGQGKGLAADTSVILANCPRYVMCSPVFDGVWDFQPMMRIMLHNQRMNGTVVSDRMIMSQRSIRDVSKGFECGSYKFPLFVLLPPSCEIIEAKSAPQFISIIENNAFTSGVTQDLIRRWKKELSCN